MDPKVYPNGRFARLSDPEQSGGALGGARTQPTLSSAAADYLLAGAQPDCKRQKSGCDLYDISLGVFDYGFIVSISGNSGAADDPNTRYFHLLDQKIYCWTRSDRDGYVMVARGFLERGHQFKARTAVER